MATFQKFTRIKFSRTQDFRKLQYLFQVFPLLFFSQLPRDNEGLLTMNRLKCTMNHNRRNWKSKSFIWNIYFRESLVEKKIDWINLREWRIFLVSRHEFSRICPKFTNIGQISLAKIYSNKVNWPINYEAIKY